MSRKKRLAAMTTSAAIFMTAAPGLARAETLQEAVSVLLETNPELGQTKYTRHARDEVVRQAKGDYYPRIDFEAGAGIQEFQDPADTSLDPRQYRLGLRQNLFTGFGTKNNVRRTKAHVRSAAYQVRDTAENIALRASKAYLDVLLKQAIVDLARENLTNHERIRDQIKLRSSSGVARKADVDQVNSRMALARSNMVVAKSNLIDAQTNYLAIVGHMPADLSQPDSLDDLMPVSMEEAERIAVENHPRLKAISADVEGREAQYDLAKAPYYPIIDFELDKIWEEDVFINPEPTRESWLAMLRLRYNLFRGMKDQARKKETAYLVDEAKEIRNNTYRQVIESIRLSWMAYQAILDRLEFLQNRVDSARKTTEAYKKQWNIGNRTLLDVLDSEAELITAKEELLTALNEKQYAQYRILDGTGRLVHGLGLQYPDQAYFDQDEKEADRNKSSVSPGPSPQGGGTDPG